MIFLLFFCWFSQVRVVRRDDGSKQDIKLDILVEEVKKILDSIHLSLFNKAKTKRDECIEKVLTWDKFIAALNDKKMILAPWCDEEVFQILAPCLLIN